MRPLAATLLSPAGYSSRSPFASNSVLNAPGTSTGVPSNVLHSFQSSLRNPNNVPRPHSPTVSTPKAARTSSPISPNI